MTCLGFCHLKADFQSSHEAPRCECMHEHISDISDFYTQVCLLNDCEVEYCARQKNSRDYSKFDQKEFLSEVQSIVETVLVHNSSTDVNTLFNRFYKMLMKIVNKHAPLKPLSKRKEKQLSKPWITNGIRRAIKIKNKYYCCRAKRWQPPILDNVYSFYSCQIPARLIQSI